MAVTQVEYKKKRLGTRYHADKKAWIGYRIDVRINNHRYRNKRFPTQREAEKFIEQLKLENTYKKAGLKFTKTEEIKVSGLLEKQFERIKSQAERVRFERVSRYFQNLLAFDLKVSEIRTTHFQIFINQRLADGVKPATVGREITALSPAFKSASELFPNELEDYDCPRIPRPRYKKNQSKQRVISEKEKDLICASLLSERKYNERSERYLNRPIIEKMFRLGWLLGLRWGEIVALKKSDFDASARRLTVIRSKTKTISFLEFLPDEVVELLTGAVTESDTGFIFNLTCSQHTVYKILENACRANGIEYGRENLNGITFHSTRHSFTTRLIQVTDLATAQSFTGHQTQEMLGYYSHASDISRREAMEKLYNKKQDLGPENLRKIFEKIKNNEMEFADFYALVTGEKMNAVGTKRTDF